MQHVATVIDAELAPVWGQLTPREQERLIMREKVVGTSLPLPEILVKIGFAKSKSEGRRLIQGGVVNIGPDKTKVYDVNAHVLFLHRP